MPSVNTKQKGQEPSTEKDRNLPASQDWLRKMDGLDMLRDLDWSAM
jgi:hypothetical protein